MIEDGFAPPMIVLERSLDMRYLGQSYEINLPFRKGSRRFLERFSPRASKALFLSSIPRDKSKSSRSGLKPAA